MDFVLGSFDFFVVVANAREALVSVFCLSFVMDFGMVSLLLEILVFCLVDRFWYGLYC